MKLYHELFIILKAAIVILYIINHLHISNYSDELEKMIEDVFALYVGVILVYLFWPWEERRITKYDRHIAFAAGTLLILTKNYFKFYDDIKRLSKKVYFTMRRPFHEMYI